MVKFKSKESPCNYVTDHQLTIGSYGKATLCQHFHNSIYDFNEKTAHLNLNSPDIIKLKFEDKELIDIKRIEII